MSFFDDMLEERAKKEKQEEVFAQEDAQLKAEKEAISWIPFLNSLTFEKQHLINNSSNPERVTADFAKNIFMVNKALSMSVDTIMYANEMNERFDLSPRMVYDYYFHSLRKSKSYAKWPKKDKSKEEFVKAVKMFFGYSTKEAERILHLIPESELQNMVEKYNRLIT